jgi:hypothetical protein
MFLSSEFGPRIYILMSSADIRADSFEEMIRLFTTLILNVDENRKM